MATRIPSPQGYCSDLEIDNFFFEYSAIPMQCSSDHLRLFGSRGVGGGVIERSEGHKHRPRMSLPPTVILSFSLFLHWGLVIVTLLSTFIIAMGLNPYHKLRLNPKHQVLFRVSLVDS